MFSTHSSLDRSAHSLHDVVRDCERRPALQQPQWDDLSLVRRVRSELAARPGLVTGRDVDTLRSLLAIVAAGEADVVQAGDCAEDPAECTSGHVARKAGLLDVLAGTMKMNTHRPVLRAGRLAGQFVKPRSQPVERVGGLELPVYRGHMINGPEPDHESRRLDPKRILAGYWAAGAVVSHLGWPERDRRPEFESLVWTSHEASLLDYELPMLRMLDSGRLLLSSTHWPWVGERTRQLEGAHVALLARIVNPVACKVGPRMTAGELLALCERLDPEREPGRLTLIARLGADKVAERLPALVSAVRAEGYPVIWLCDPMHGNTVVSPEGIKTRFVETMVREVLQFQAAVRASGGVAGGLHLEATPDDVTECVQSEAHIGRIGDKYTSFCDPRLNPRQALSVMSAWRG